MITYLNQTTLGAGMTCGGGNDMWCFSWAVTPRNPEIEFKIEFKMELKIELKRNLKCHENPVSLRHPKHKCCLF